MTVNSVNKHEGKKFSNSLETTFYEVEAISRWIFFLQLLPSHINKYNFFLKKKVKNYTKYLSLSCHKFASSFSHFLHPLDLTMWRISLQSEKLEASSSFFSFPFLREMEQKKNQTEERLSTEIKMKLLFKIYIYIQDEKVFFFMWELYKMKSCKYEESNLFNIFF